MVDLGNRESKIYTPTINRGNDMNRKESQLKYHPNSK